MKNVFRRRDFITGGVAAACAAVSGGLFADSGTAGGAVRPGGRADLAALAKEDIFKLVGRDWMLVCAGTKDRFNMMTASCGCVGWLWNKPVAYIYVHPDRHTHSFLEREARFTLSFFGDEWKEALRFCGSRSGRDYDKCKETGLKGIALESGAIGFEQARLILDCRKIMKSMIEDAHFLDRELFTGWYGKTPGRLHDVYVGVIESVYES